MLCLGMQRNVMLRFMVQRFQDPPSCSSSLPTPLLFTSFFPLIFTFITSFYPPLPHTHSPDTSPPPSSPLSNLHYQIFNNVTHFLLIFSSFLYFLLVNLTLLVILLLNNIPLIIFISSQFSRCFWYPHYPSHSPASHLTCTLTLILSLYRSFSSKFFQETFIILLILLLVILLWT